MSCTSSARSARHSESCPWTGWRPSGGSWSPRPSSATGGSILNSLLIWRYGAATYALPAYEEFGLSRASEESLTAWVSTRFTADNAVLSLSGNLPPGLALHLADGSRSPAPVASSACPELPAWFEGPGGTTALMANLPRSMDALALCRVAESELLSSLRYTMAASYSPQAVHTLRDATTATLLCLAEPMRGQEVQVRNELVELLDRVIDRGPDEAVLKAWRSQIQASAADPALRRGFLHSRAWDTLVGAAPQTPEEWVQATELVSYATVVDAARVAARDVLYRVPSSRPLSRRGIVQAPQWSSTSMTGPEYYPRPEVPQMRGLSLVLGAEGVRLRVTEKERLAVTNRACAAVLAWPDGRRLLIGTDGMTINIEPKYWIKGGDIVSHIDAIFPHDLRAPIPARPPGAGGLPPRPPEPSRRWATVGGLAVAWALLIAGTVHTVATLTVPGSQPLPPLGLVPFAAWWLVRASRGNLRALRRTRASLGLVGLPRSAGPRRSQP